MRATAQRILIGFAAMAVGLGIWLVCVHLVFARTAEQFNSHEGLSPFAKQLAARQLAIWSDPKLREHEIQRMRASNAEWDFMGRSFLVWSLANMSLRNPDQAAGHLGVMDRIIDATLEIEREQGMHVFLMSYSKSCPYVVQPARSLFVDGEISLMLVMRRLLAEKPEYQLQLQERVKLIADGLRNRPQMLLESYPNECWLFDHCVALAALRLADQLDGSDHSALIRDWLAMAKTKLTDRESGLLMSSFTCDGQALDGPEGSSLWMALHCIQLLDADFARSQYELARKQLGKTTLGFGYAREWPASWHGPADIDSGPIIPGLNISAGSSGMALIGASAFRDENFLGALATTLEFAAFPSRRGNQLKFCASNQVGDAVMLYAATLGPLWERINTGKP